MKFFATIFFSVLLLIDVFGQYPEYNLQTFNTDNGLPYGNIHSIVQDSQGYMWFGTSSGLLKYDGYSFTSYKKGATKNSLSTDIITNLYKSIDNILFIGTRQGLHFYNSKTLEIQRIENPHVNTQIFGVNQIIEPKPQQLITSSFTGNTLLEINYQKNNESFQISATKIPFNISYIVVDKKNRTWYGNSTKLYCKIKSQIKSIAIDIPDGFITGLHTYKDNSILIRTSKGIYTWNEKTQTVIEVPFQFVGITNKDLYVNQIHIDSKGNIYIATDNQGLLIIDKFNNQIAHYKHNPANPLSIQSNSINCVYTDNLGNIWFGILGEGIQVLYKNQICYTHYYYKQSFNLNSLPSNHIKAAIIDSTNNIWLATDGEGLCYINKLTGKVLTFDYSHISSNKLMCLQLHKNIIYAGTYNGGFTSMNITDKIPTKIPIIVNNKEAKNIYDFEFISDTKILIASIDAGLILYNTITKQSTLIKTLHWNKRTEQINQYVSSIQKDFDNNYWIASLGDGIYVLNKDLQLIDMYNSWEKSNKITNSIVSCLALDSVGRIWAGTMDGISVIDRKRQTIRNITKANNLISANITHLSCDKNSVWATNLDGLTKINSKTFKIENFTTIDGIISSRLSFISTTILPNNKLLVTGDNGIMEVFSNQIKTRTPALSFHISNIYVNEKPHQFQKKIILAHNENNIRLAFPAFNYAYSHKISYECVVTSHTTVLHNLGNKPEIYFANLPPGTYNIELRAFFENRKSAARTISFSIVISPPFWKTWWFIVFLISCKVSIIVYLIKQRMRRVRQQAFLLEQKVFERTQKILLQTDELQKQAEQLKAINDELVRTNSEQTKLFDIVSQKKISNGQNTQLPKSHDDELLEKTIAFIHEHIADIDLSVEQLSSHANYSKIQFYRKIKNLTELTPIDVIKTIRLQKAEEMLVTGKYSIAEVCYKVGFSDPRYFSKCFKEKYNTSPTEYTKKI